MDKLGKASSYTIIIKNIVVSFAQLENIKVEDILSEGLEFTEGKIYVNGVEALSNVVGNYFKLKLAEVTYSKEVRITFKVKAT